MYPEKIWFPKYRKGRKSCWKDWGWNWKWTRAGFRTRPLIDWLRDIPDPRSSRSKPHELAEIFVCIIIMGLLAGKTKLRRIVRWGKRHLAELRRHMPFPNGVPSVSTMSGVLAVVDEEMVSPALINWIGEALIRGGYTSQLMQLARQKTS